MSDPDPFEGIEDLFPASPAQAGILFETLANPDAVANRGLMLAKLPATLDLPRFEAAWAEVFTRHQSLRSRLLWEGLSEPILVIEQEVEPQWQHLDWRGAADAEARLDDLCDDLRKAPFDLSTAPTSRLVLIRGDAGYDLVWVMHHALMDDWSVEVVFRETAAVYAGQTLPPAMPYRDFADWRAGQGEDGHWAELMAGFDGPSRLGFAPAAQTATGAAHIVSQRDVPIAPLVQTAKDMRVTLGAVLTTVWSLVVQRLSGEADVAFGIATTERPAELPGAAQAVGMFVATQPARLRIETADVTLRDLILARQTASQEAQGRPAPLLADISDHGMPFETILSINESGMGGAQALYGDVCVRNHSSFPLAMVMRPEETLGLVALWSPDRFAPEDIETLLDALQAAFAAVPAGLDAPAVTLGIGPAVEEGPPLGDAPLIPDALAGAMPDTVAVQEAGAAVTYAELERLTHAFAAQLQTKGVRPGNRIAVLMPRGAACLAAFLAAWRVGASYIPLDPAQPDARLGQMVAEGQAAVVMTDAGYADRLASPSVVADPEFGGALTPHETQAQDEAYVMFTSGSTGLPKGVVVSHANLAASTAARPVWYDDRPERYMVVSPFGFDSSVAGIYWTLAQGGTLVLPSPQVVQDIPNLAAMIETHRVTHMLCLPSLYDLLLGQAEALSHLHCVIVAGEAATPDLVARHHSLRPGMRLVNEYGPTEATVWCSVAELPDTPGPVPIGRAIPGGGLSVRGPMGQPVPDGVAGELWVAGPGVARYLHGDDPAFVTQDGTRFYRTGDQVRRGADGQLIYLGRRDAQVKIGGQRIELGEVESRLLDLPGVTGAAVVVVSGAYLVAYVTGAQSVDVSGLPDAMRPRVVTLDALPQTATGKVDRKALQARGLPQQTRAVAPVGDVETQVAAIWQDLLGFERLPDVTTGFFALGGTSLMAMRLVAAVNDAFEAQVSLPQILGAQNTIRTLAVHIGSGAPAAAASDAEYPVPATESQKALWLAAKMRPDQPYFNLSKAVQIDRVLDVAALAEAAHKMIAQHAILGCTLTLAHRQLTVTPSDALPKIEVQDGADDLDAWLQTQSAQVFAMDGGPLWRIAAVPHGAGIAVCVTIHHTISDGWSLDILMQDLVAVLLDRPLPAPTRSFAGLAPPAAPSPGQSVWDEMLAEAPYGPRLAPDRALPDRSDSAGVLAQGEVPRHATEAVLAQAAQANTTPFAVLWAATALWLARETGQSDSVVAVSHAGRSQPGFDRTIGCFTYALPYRLDVSDAAGAVARAAKRAALIQAHEDISIGALALPASDAPRGYLTSFSPIALQFNDFDWTAGGGDAAATPIPFTPTLTSFFEVSIEWAMRDGVLTCAILARADLYDRATVEGWVARLIGGLQDGNEACGL